MPRSKSHAESHAGECARAVENPMQDQCNALLKRFETWLASYFALVCWFVKHSNRLNLICKKCENSKACLYITLLMHSSPTLNPAMTCKICTCIFNPIKLPAYLRSIFQASAIITKMACWGHDDDLETRNKVHYVTWLRDQLRVPVRMLFI